MASPWNHHERRLSAPLQPDEKDVASETSTLPRNEYFSSHLNDYDFAEGDEDEKEKEEKLECSLYDIEDPYGFDLLSPVDSDSISPTIQHEALQTNLQSETDRPRRLEKEMDGIPSFSASATTVVTGRPTTTAVASQPPKEETLDPTVLYARKLPAIGETCEMTSDEILALCLQEEFYQQDSLEETRGELLTRYLQEEWEHEESLESASDETQANRLQEDRSHQESLRAMSDEALARCMQEQWNEEESPQEEWNQEDDALTQVYINYTAPDSLEIARSDDMFAASVPTPYNGSDCSICLCEMKPNGQHELKCLAKCGHAFHFSCISQALKKHRQCPNCRTFLGTPRGKMPSGSMRVTFDSRMTCSGHAPGTICIDYSIQGGIQKEYHNNPGVRFGSTTRRAYLPDGAQGRDLLKRLKYAFAHGLTFTVGTSLTTHQTNTVTWSSVHHKTTTRGGAHGFPDPNYFTNCHSELDHLGVPATKDL